MESILIDTDVFSFLFKGDTRSHHYSQFLKERAINLSFMSVAEIKRWSIQRKWAAKRLRELADALSRCVIIPYDRSMIDVWAAIAAHRDSIGRPIGCGDCWIAATAVRHGLPLVTHNASHFVDIPGLKVLTRSDKT